MKIRTRNFLFLVVALVLALSFGTVYADVDGSANGSGVYYDMQLDVYADGSVDGAQRNENLAVYETVEYFTVDESADVVFDTPLELKNSSLSVNAPIPWTDLSTASAGMAFGGGRYQGSGTAGAHSGTTYVTITVTAYKYNSQSKLWDKLTSGSGSGYGYATATCSGAASSGQYKSVISVKAGVDTFNGESPVYNY